MQLGISQSHVNNSRGTAPEQPVEWTYSVQMVKQRFTNFKNFIGLKFANLNEF